MTGYSLWEFFIVVVFLFPIPSIVTGYLAERKGRSFWGWFGYGFLLAISGNLLFVFVHPLVQLLGGAVAGPLVILRVKPSRSAKTIKPGNDSEEPAGGESSAHSDAGRGTPQQ